MWQLKYNSGYSMFFEYPASESYKRLEYNVYVDDHLLHDNINSNTFSIFSPVNKRIEVRIESKNGIELQKIFELKDDNYFVNIKDYLIAVKEAEDISSKLQALILSLPSNTTLFFPAGKYNITSLILKSDLKVVFDSGVIFDVNTCREDFPIIPGMVENKKFNKEFCVSTWEGNPQACFSSIISGYNLDNVEIIGEATIEGNATDDNWYHDVRNKIYSWRPKTLFFNNCSNVTVHGINIFNSPSWTIHPFYCNNMAFYDVFIKNPKISPNTDGINPESCENVEINGCNFDLGDDCIAVKSGKLYMGLEHYKPTKNLKITNCKMEHGHGAIVLGSEISCGVQNLEISNCLFNDTDRGLRVKTRRGRGEKSVIDNVVFINIEMTDVRAPITINAFYRCDPDGDSDYVASKEPVASKEDTPILGSFQFDKINCYDAHHVICMAYGLPESYIKQVQISNSTFTFAKEPEAGHPLMMRDLEDKCEVPFELLNVESLVLENNKFLNTDKNKNSFTNVLMIKDENNEYCK